MPVKHEDWLQAQYSVLGSVLIEPQLAAKVMHLTRAEDFSGGCRTVYDAMRSLFVQGLPVDIISLSNELKGQYRDFLRQLMVVTPTAANVDHYIKLCRQQAQIQQARSIGASLAAAEDVQQVRKLLEEANGLMVDKAAVKIVTMHDALKSFMERHAGDVKYLSWPIPELNDRLYSEPGDFILIGGYPSTGKSAWSIQCAKHWARSCKVGFFSLETSDAKLFDRQMASMSDLTMDDIKRNRISDKQWGDIGSMAGTITGLQLELISAAGYSVADIRSVTMMRRYQVIIIDYVQLLSAGGINRTEQVTNISLALHRMAQDMGVTVVALSQLKRKNGDETPENSDLRESGQLEQDADVIQILKLLDKDKPDGPRELYITKNKEGTCPKILLDFDGKHQTFRKANRSNEVASKLIADGKKKRQRNAAAAKERMNGQYSLLDGEDPDLPFKEEPPVQQCVIDSKQACDHAACAEAQGVRCCGACKYRVNCASRCERLKGAT